MYNNEKLNQIQILRDCERKAVIRYSEDLRNSPPTKRQINHIKRLFADFGFKRVAIPHFDTYAELDNWKRTKLEELLDKGE